MNKILIIDDEKDICMLLGAMLKKFGYTSYTANSITEGRQKLQEIKPDLVFLDINLPDGLGFSIIPKIKERYPEAKIIMISAYDSSKEKNRALIEGADNFISKPFNSNTIKETLQQVDPR